MTGPDHEPPDGNGGDDKVIELTVPTKLANERADKIVTELLALSGEAVPRAEVQRWMQQDKVTREGAPVPKRARLAAGTRLRVEKQPPPLSHAEPDPSIAVDVHFEDEHLLVINKPAHLVVHPARGHATGTLVNGLLARGGFDANTADPRDAAGHLRPGIVHRLDKDTSGLLVVAKNATVREGLKDLFARHDIERSYLAIVLGKAQKAHYDTPHGRHPSHRLRFTSKLPADRPGVRRAQTHIEPVEALNGATLVRCTLETGRTHQIRVHLSECGHTPILADTLYGGTPPDPTRRAIAERLGRQALHAAVLGFRHPISGERMRWEMPLPADMKDALEALRATTS